MSATSRTPAAEARITDRFSRASNLLGIVARDPVMFRSLVDAFDAGDGKLFQHLLAELRVGDACGEICAWLRSKESVLVCLEVCGPPPRPPLTVEQIVRFAEVVSHLSQDEYMTRRLVDAVEDRDAVAFKTAVTELGAEQLCHLLCHWISVVRYRLICEVVCGEQVLQTDQVVAELMRSGAAVGQLVKKNVSLRSAIAAAVASDPASLSDILSGFADCEWICEWICSWRCVWICLPICESFPYTEATDPIEEMRQFALFSARLAENKDAFPRLLAALQSGDSQSFAALVTEFKAEAYCMQLCHWLCYEVWSRWCIIICPPPAAQPWFTTVGYFNIYSDIDSSTGLTNKSLSFPSLAYGGGPNFAFMGPLQLGGFCPSFSPTSPGTAMKYRFLYSIGGSPGVAITGPLVSQVENTRTINWPQNVGGVAGAALVTTFQTVIIEYSPTPLPPDPTPPAPGAPWVAPSAHYITPDADGWVAVDPNAVGDGFQQLLGFDTTKVVIGGSAPGPGAGNPVPSAQQEVGTDMSITFEATRTTTTVPPAAPDYSNALSKIHINNWTEVNQLNFLEYATGCCTPINDALHVQFTVDHEEMGAGAWSLDISSCSPSAPGDITPYSTTLTTGISAAQPTITVASSSGFPTAPFNLVVSTGENMTVTNVSGTTLTVLRGQNGTLASPALAGTIVATYSGPPLTARGGSGTVFENTTTWSSCSYVVTLSTRPGLTTGLSDRSVWNNSLTFCICGH